MQQTHQNIDTSAQAMTEVALGLSMAFFSLLILALISLGAGQSINKSSDVALIKQTPMSQNSETGNEDLLNQPRLLIDQKTESQKRAGQADQSKVEESDFTFVFYSGGQYYDDSLQLTNIASLDTEHDIVLVLEPSLPLSQVMRVQADFSGKKVQVTEMNQEWSKALSESAQQAARP